MTEFDEDRVYARHRPRQGAVLIVGTGAVGGFVAEELSRIGISPLWLVDPKNLRVENLVRHPLGAQYVGQPKASTLAAKIRREFPRCEAIGIDEDFRLDLSPAEQLRLVNSADVVVAAGDNFDCQQSVNRVCLEAEKPAVFPAVWVDPDHLRDAEVGEIQWVLPGRHTPCYECAFAFRQAEADAQAARGARVDIQLLSLTTAQVVAALLDPSDERSAILNNRDNRNRLRTCIYLHGFTPTSPAAARAFPGPGLRNRFVRIPFPPRPCPACHASESEAGPRPPRPDTHPPRPPPPPRPHIRFAVSVDSLRVSVDTSGTTPSTGVIFAYDWGDDSVISDRPIHTYARAGTYRIRITATNAGGVDIEVDTIRVTAPPQPTAPPPQPAPVQSIGSQLAASAIVALIASALLAIICFVMVVVLVGKQRAEAGNPANGLPANNSPYALYGFIVGIMGFTIVVSIIDYWVINRERQFDWQVVGGLTLVFAIILGVLITLFAKHQSASAATSVPPPAASSSLSTTVELKCDPNIGGSFCQPGGNGDLLALDILGVPNIYDLCNSGYSIHFTDNHGDNLENFSGTTCLIDLLENGSGIPYVGFPPPTSSSTGNSLCGRWVIKLRIKDPSGAVVHAARYSTVVRC